MLFTGIEIEAADVRVLSAVGMRQVMSELGPAFERATGHRLAIEFASSGVILQRLESGESLDVVMVPRSGIERLRRAGKLRAGAATAIATSRVGVAVRTGAPRPDISTPEALKRALLDARSIACPDPASGGSSALHIATVFERLGIASALKTKTVFSTAPDQVAAGAVVAAGKAELALHQIQELMAVPGIEIVGPLPDALQETFVFSAALLAGAREPAAARALLAFLTTPEARAVVKAKGMGTALPERYRLKK